MYSCQMWTASSLCDHSLECMDVLQCGGILGWTFVDLLTVWMHAWVICLGRPVRPAALEHTYGGGRIASFAELAWKCCSTCVEHSSHKLLPVVVCRLWNQNNSARVVTEKEKHRIHLPKILLVVMWGPWTCMLSFVCWTGPTCGDQQFGPV